MAEEHQLPSDSDEDDEDYVPEGLDNEPVSEVDSEGDAESGSEDENDENKRKDNKKKTKKRTKGGKSKSKKRRKTLEVNDDNDENEDEASKATKELTEEEQKKRADSLWADFMKDTGTATPKSKPQPQESTNSSKQKPSPVVKPKAEEKVKITKVFEFAGEEVKIEKEVPVDSLEARLSLSSAENSTKAEDSSSASRASGRGRGTRRGGLGGISSVLSQIGKKAKISTLEKSKLDWDSYKKQENLEEEITTFNKGKDGYLEKQDFLQRADLRQFEIEKQLRNTTRRSTR